MSSTRTPGCLSTSYVTSDAVLLPVFYGSLKGHDYSLYVAVLDEAKYFQIPRLERWIGDKKYIQAVTTAHTAAVVEGADALGKFGKG